MRAVLTIPIKAAIGNHQILSVVAVWIRPSTDGRDRPLYGEFPLKMPTNTAPFIFQLTV